MHIIVAKSELLRGRKTIGEVQVQQQEKDLILFFIIVSHSMC